MFHRPLTKFINRRFSRLCVGAALLLALGHATAAALPYYSPARLYVALPAALRPLPGESQAHWHARLTPLERRQVCRHYARAAQRQGFTLRPGAPWTTPQPKPDKE